MRTALFQSISSSFSSFVGLPFIFFKRFSCSPVNGLPISSSVQQPFYLENSRDDADERVHSRLAEN
jgi:hypothetical protein